MVTISIIGSGNVAQHLISAFAATDGINLLQIFSRHREVDLESIPQQKVVNDFAKLLEADIYIIAVSDNAISEVSKQLPFSGRLVVHTSGSQPIEAIDAKHRRGVFYPLQTFTKNKAVDFRRIPICIESTNDRDREILERVANSISLQTYVLSSDQRKALHVAAVFANNFTNHLYNIASEICRQNDIPFEILKPLIAETADKVMTLSPLEAQTGPAKRNDTNTIETHLDFLKSEKLIHIYKTLTQSIIDDGKKL